ncbi:MAG: ABC transporter permease [Oscillospiraceae bacterium]|nr:ABC transporter permease [Oscillospiraceae bacterium]
MKNEELQYTGRLLQVRIYLGKFLRMFVFQNDWKILPMGAIIAAVVTFVIGTNLFQTQEGTKIGVFALVCVCIWNGFFNSIQAVCREREIIKREHRAGLHMSSYVAAQMVYQLILCAAQTVVTMLICRVTGVQFPEAGLITSTGTIDVAITLLLITYAADLMALMVSCIVRTTTTAMTTMPFLLLYQLVFSGGFFDVSGVAEKLKYLTISHWGMDALCSIGRYNEEPMVSVWNMLVSFKDIEIQGQTPLKDILIKIEAEGLREPFLLWSAQNNSNPDYAADPSVVLTYWGALVALMLIFAIISVVALEFIDKDKR